MDYNKIDVRDGLKGVRSKLSMYIGSTGVVDDRAPRALIQMSQEALSNSLDEYIAGFGDEIAITIKPDNTMIVADHGRGVPRGQDFSDSINAFTKTHASGKFDDSAYATNGIAGTHGIGMKAVNAASARFIVDVVCKSFDSNGIHTGEYESYTLSFEKGELINTELHGIGALGEISCPEWLSSSTGTMITFLPDIGPISDDNLKPVLESNDWPIEELVDRITASAFLTPGSTISIHDERTDTHIVKSYEHGLSSYMQELGHDPSSIISTTATATIDQYDITADITIAPGEGIIRSYANGVPTKDGGYHEDGFRSHIGKALSTYADDKFSSQDALDALDVMIHVKVPSSIVEFEGQTKEKLATVRARKAIRQIVQHQLLDAFYDNTRASNAIVEKANDAKALRDALQQTREATKRMRESSRSLGLSVSSKLKAATSRNPKEKELYITEGDSASNIGRDPKTQAVMPLRGKIKNVFESKLVDALKNKEVSTIASVLGAGVASEFNVDDMQYHKVIIATDADSDGLHIQTLLIGMCYKLYPGMIEAGRLYVVQPPLYKAVKYINGQPDTKIYYTESEMADARPSLQGYEIRRFKGLGEMSQKEAHEALANKQTRRLIQITQEDGANAVLSMLIGCDSPARKQWLEDEVNFSIVS